MRCSLPVLWWQPLAQPTHTLRRRQPQPLCYKPPALRRCKLYKPALRDARLHDLFKVATVFFLYSCATKWSSDCEVKAMTHGATMKDPLQSLRGNSLAILHFSQHLYVLNRAVLSKHFWHNDTMTQSDTFIKDGVKCVRPHYNTFCKCVPCDFTHTGSLFKLTTHGYHFL